MLARGRCEMAYLVSLIFPGVFGEITEWRNANFNIAHRPQRCSVLVGPDLRAGRFLAGTVTLLGRLGRSAPTTFPCTYALAKHTRNGISQQALAAELSGWRRKPPSLFELRRVRNAGKVAP